MKKVDLLPELVYAPRLLLVANEGVFFNNSLVDLLLKIIQVHHRAVLAKSLAKLRNKPCA
jgi:DNA polymerase III psi subunit